MVSNNRVVVSVCIASYNGSKYIEQQIKSILDQLPGENDELIVSDDNSTDNTVEIVKSIADDRIKLYSSNFRDVTRNFEFAISKAKGDYVFLSDQDDIWHKDKINTYLKYLEDYDLVYSNVAIIDGDNKIKNETLYSSGKEKRGFLKNFLKNSGFGGTFGFKSHVIKKAMPFPSNIEMHDAWILLVCELFFLVKYIETPMLLHRRHGKNYSSASEKSTNSFGKKILIRVRYLKYLILLVLFRRKKN